MLATDVAPNRMAAARAAAATFIKGLPNGFKVGIVSFSDKADVNLPPTSDHEEALQALNAIQAENGTALGDAISRSVNVGLDEHQGQGRAEGDAARGGRPVGRREHDGRPDAAPGGRPGEDGEGAGLHGRARHAERHDHDQRAERRHAHLQRAAGSRRRLRAVAQTTGGKFFEAADAKSLKSIYSGIGKTVGTKIEKRELSAAFTGAGAVVLLLGSALSLAWFNRLP